MTHPSAPPPTATYRLQLQPDFPFAAAGQAVPYLARLGISHLHLSPVLEAVPGSTHGYDVVDHTAVRAELGGERGLRALAATARAHGLGLIADLVPNHMAVPAPMSLNGPLWRVLRDGPASPWARWFDIDWEAGHGGRVLLPVLAGRLGDELPRLRVTDGTLRYGRHAFPLRPGTEELPLPRLLDAQWYRLAWWRLARTELNYRRFFTVPELIGVRVEDPEVFEATHATVVRLVRDGVLDGLRVDHPDGLADPAAYLERLDTATGGCRTVVEKILTGVERLPRDWTCAGTTGYDALRHLDALFVCPEGARTLLAHYRAHAAPPPDRGGDWAVTVRRAAYEVLNDGLAAEVERLVRAAGRIAAADGGDHAPWALRRAIRELLVRLPVYRPYPARASGAARDAALLDAAARGAREAFPVAAEARSVELIRTLALGGTERADAARESTGTGGAPGEAEGAGDEGVGAPGPGGDALRGEVAAFAARFAQTASALHAKSVEDTAGYRHPVLLSACEVGGDPGRPALDPEAFHAYCAHLQAEWPGTSTVLTTHDTKRSGDVRARIAVLSECPDRWRDALREAGARPRGGPEDGPPGEPGAAPRGEPDGAPGAPDPVVAWLAWQNAFGLGTPPTGEPPVAERLTAAVLKSVREAGLRTSWSAPDTGYEDAVARFVRSGPGGPGAAVVRKLADELAPFLRANVLGTALLHLTMPGVPDLYQDSEREYTALVDPDNRRPARPLPALLARLDDGGAPSDLSAEKLALTAAALRLRRDRPQAFGADGSYLPLYATGPAAAHCVAFCRGGAAVSVATRLSLRLARSGGWRGTTLRLPDAGRWREALTGRVREGGAAVDLDELLDGAPVALLTAE
ncbi:malto-oligosyltrehalose synthase [Streptomyces catenulae]|uniref:Malto-oligosyltrehalose synthase n=1 Tax=Streptomyces catenulae TaxID=66875 RepID=A0ABV2Z4W4_9ACTN|nr:malto-oligosyltrehalose synthase [Streptomyces catenulae]